ncbi:hypothetical protein HY622_02380 [Candidatus Uhrbacteria bacterium]|nr:hypothetical protein [Candidatus Uhrbacteria bacterium]
MKKRFIRFILYPFTTFGIVIGIVILIQIIGALFSYGGIGAAAAIIVVSPLFIVTVLVNPVFTALLGCKTPDIQGFCALPPSYLWAWFAAVVFLSFFSILYLGYTIAVAREEISFARGQGSALRFQITNPRRFVRTAALCILFVASAQIVSIFPHIISK